MGFVDFSGSGTESWLLAWDSHRLVLALELAPRWEHYPNSAPLSTAALPEVLQSHILLGAPTALPLACWCSHSKLLQEWAGEDTGDTELLDLLHCYLKCILCVRDLQIPAKHRHSWMGRSFPPDCAVTNWEWQYESLVPVPRHWWQHNHRFRFCVLLLMHGSEHLSFKLSYSTVTRVWDIFCLG